MTRFIRIWDDDRKLQKDLFELDTYIEVTKSSIKRMQFSAFFSGLFLGASGMGMLWYTH